MNSLLGYGSDDDYDDSSEEKQPDWRAGTSKDKSSAPQLDANYEEVQMDLSEESDESKPETTRSRSDKDKREADKDSHRSRSDRDRDRERHSRDRDNKRRDRDRDRKSRRSSSRERRRSRSPRKSKRSKSRSRSRERKCPGNRRYEKTSSKMAQLDKMGIEIKTPDCQYVKPSDLQKSMAQERDKPNDNRFFMPGITGRFRDQIERRKQLWQKKEPANNPVEMKTNEQQGKKVWESTTFAQDSDGKVANKFKRLMGIRGAGGASGSATEGLKKQEEMFSSMEQQYEVARTATHTMRGVGLGFGSFQR